MKKCIKTSLLSLFVILWLCLSFYLWSDYYKYSSYIHYHANFWVFINWEKIDFSDDKYMEDISACKLWNEKTQKDRAHLHENNPWAIHIHDDWVTWWHFFSNIWYNFTDNFLSDDNWNIYQANSDKKLTFILNWEEIKNPFNRQIKSEDVLLIDYWNWDIKNEYSQINIDAWMYNNMDDPTTCSWSDFSIFKFINDNIFQMKWH